MYSFVLVGVLTAAIALWLCLRCKLQANQKLAILLAVIGFTGLGGHGLGLVFGSFAPLEYELVKGTPLVAMRTAEGATGTFVFGSGRIEHEMIYMVYARNANGSFTPHRITADKQVMIFQNPALVNEGTWQTHRPVVDKTWFLSGFAIIRDSERSHVHHLIVPTGTVVQQFSAR